MDYRHGVYTTEQPTSLTVPINGTAGLQIVFGTAPIHLTKDPAAAVNKPTIVYSFNEAVELLGYSYNWKKFTLCQSMDACFRVFNIAPIIYINVLDPSNSNHVTDNSAESYMPVDEQVFYPVQYVLLATLVLSVGGASLEVDTDFIAEHAEDGSVLITLVSDAAKSAESISITSSSLNPDGVTYTDIIGGANTITGEEKGLELIRQIYPKFGMTAGLLLAPGWSHNPNVAAVMQAKTESINGVFSCETILDIDASADGCTRYSDVKTYKEAMGASSKHAVALWPQVKVGENQYYYSAVFGALTAYTDATNGDIPNLSPSNKDVRITATVLADGTEVLLDQEQGNLVNSYGVITAINHNGFKSWGNNTCIYPSSTDPKDRWFACRRFFTWRGNSFILTYFQKVDDPANPRLIENIVDSENITGNSFVARGYCAGYRLEYLPEENTVLELLDGTVSFHMYLAPYVPAEVIKCTLEFDTVALSEALGGE